jgi:hypothetical protein
MEVDLIQDGLLRVEREKPESESPFPPRLDSAVQTPAHTPSGICPVCNERPSNRHCLHCDRDVCAQDHWVMLGLCKTCVTKKEMADAREPTLRRPDLDIKWIED